MQPNNQISHNNINFYLCLAVNITKLIKLAFLKLKYND
jgi:hypothetical protein